ncbi:hypothetical protein SASPL_121553 [Salvia splendens]|uniref:Uncharacterized protein n=1 Tax=Salvia splendens TaxID=180675 RepID=A0A8X8XSN1_SALSN|nr:hypothetical protein SASPL_121553 [Salvia splendens]
MIETQSNAAEIHCGPISGEKLHEMLDEFSVPRCLFAGVERIKEFGFNRATGFYWVKQEKKTERKVDKVGTQLTGFITPGRLSKITGVKAKEIILTFTVTGIVVGVPSSDKAKFVSSTGIYGAHPIAA